MQTSEMNYDATVACFEENDYFGLDPADVIFFKQGMWPGMTPDGKIILEAPGRIFMSPDGHGGMIAALKANGCFKNMRERGVKTLFYFQVDNPLVDVADPAFIGLHTLEKSEYSLKLTAKRDPYEGLGMVVKRDGHFDMIEYTEMTDEMNNRRRADAPRFCFVHNKDLERRTLKRLACHSSRSWTDCVLALSRIPRLSEAPREVP